MNYAKLPKPFLALAPLYDVTDTVFRQIIASCATPDLFFTEFTNVDGLQSAGREKIIHRLKFSESEKPIVAQIWGKEPENYRKTARELVEMGFDGIDINMGCPDKAVLKNGCCAALINNHELAADIINATKKGTGNKIPISVKTRIGIREFDREWIKFLLEQKLSMLSIHLRTVREMSKVPAHWELMDEIRRLRDLVAPDTLLVGNGDVGTRQQAVELAKKYGIDGIIIGRGVFSDPFVFAESSPWTDWSKQQKIDLYRKHVELFVKTWGEDSRPVAPLNKFCKIYINGFDGAKETRTELMETRTAEELLEKIRRVL
jgi:tRNA-dihydrouridine synthase